jgi:response regulator RpfG family c-di-GMP phosphodiesterase
VTWTDAKWPDPPRCAWRAPLERANILIVDDLPDKLLVFRTILEELDQNIVTARARARRRCGAARATSSR